MTTPSYDTSPWQYLAASSTTEDSGNTARFAMSPHAVDDRLFRPPFILIDPDNHGRPVDTPNVPSPEFPSAIAGQLTPGFVGYDVDPGDTDADPEAGVAASEDLAAWFDRLGLPWILRDSGRPGHRHVIAMLPPSLRRVAAATVAAARSRHGVGLTARTCLRLLSSPHRLGLASPVIDSNFTLGDLPQPQDAAPSTSNPLAARKRRHGHRDSRRSRSEREFGEVLWRVRRGWSRTAAWDRANRPGTKAREMGPFGWQRWMWAPAVTTVDRERGIPEHKAWANFAAASPYQAQFLGHATWFERYWAPVAPLTPISASRNSGPRRQVSAREDVDLLRKAFDQVAVASAQNYARLPERVRFSSLRAALHAVAEATVRGHTRLSIRLWSRMAHLDPKTVLRARNAALAMGLIVRTHRYAGGAHDCDTWRPSHLVTDRLTELRESTTWGYTPTIQQRGRASLRRLRRVHRQEQGAWQARWRLLSAIRDDALACASGAGLQTLRSVLYQRAWWLKLAESEKLHRIKFRRHAYHLLHGAKAQEARTWFRTRGQIVSSAIRIADHRERPHDASVVSLAPSQVHTGRQDLAGARRNRRPSRLTPVNGNDSLELEKHTGARTSPIAEPRASDRQPVGCPPSVQKVNYHAFARLSSEAAKRATLAEGRSMQSQRPNQQDQARFLRVGQAARLLGISTMTIYRAIDADQFPAIRIRGRIVIPAGAIDAMEAAAVESMAPVDAADFIDRSGP